MKYNPYPNSDKYSHDNWNEIKKRNTESDRRFLYHFVTGNFYAFMNKLLDFEWNGQHPWIPKKERKYGARRK